MAEIYRVCRHSEVEAKETSKWDWWKDSFEENCRCAKSIQNAVLENYEEAHLIDRVKELIEKYGRERMHYVLANTIQSLPNEFGFSEENKRWAETISIPKDDCRKEFCVYSYPGRVDCFTNQVLQEWKNLGLFELSQCEYEGERELFYDRKVLVINPYILKTEFQKPEYQLFWANDGFGQRPYHTFNFLYGKYLGNGNKDKFRRKDILGVLKEEYLPEWAEQKLKEFESEEKMRKTQKIANSEEIWAKDITMGGM